MFVWLKVSEKIQELIKKKKELYERCNYSGKQLVIEKDI